MSGKCAICSKSANLKCSNCGRTFYCCKEHQAQHWKNGHSTDCILYKIKENDQIGRYLISKRLIKQGEIILKKQPLVLAPKLASQPLCLSCHKTLKINNDTYKCQKCSWPLCSKNCEKNDTHLIECKVLSKVPDFIKNITTSTYCFIAPLRVLLMENLNKTKYDSVMQMQDHLDKLKNSSMAAILQQSVLPAISQLLTNVNNETVMRICSIFDTNSFDVRSNKLEVNVRGLFPIINLVSHDCTKNTCHYFIPEENFAMALMATVDIPKGSLITTTYTQSLWGTLERRMHLQRVKYFDCMCKRCGDPTEFGCYVGSHFCEKCNSNNVKAYVISSNSLENGAFWKCNSCDYKEEVLSISKRNQQIKTLINQIDKSTPVAFEKFLAEYEKKLPSTNSYILQIKYALVEMYGRINTTELPSDQLVKKIKFLNELLFAANKLEGGVSEFNILLQLLKIEADCVETYRNNNKGIIANNLEKCHSIFLNGPKTEKLTNVYNNITNNLTMLQ